jgi:hypothetical protein
MEDPSSHMTGHPTTACYHHYCYAASTDLNSCKPQSILFFAAIDAQLLYAAPILMVCMVSGYRQ